MVQIPTAADIQRSGTRSGRLAPQGPSVSVGAGLADLGRGLVSAAYNLNDLQTQERADTLDKKANDVSTNLTRFLADEEQRFLSARDESTESGIGFTRQFMEEYQKRANEFAKSNFDGLTGDAQTRYLNTVLSRGNDLFAKSNSFESSTKTDYYQRTTNSSLDTVRTQIRNNSGDFDALKKQGYEQIDSAAMPEPWKAARRAAWDSDAAESRWQWEYSQNPEQAVDDMRGESSIKPAKLTGTVAERGSYALRFFQQKGYTAEQAAGIVGNLIQESNLDPSGAVGDNGTAFGVAQWRGERFNRLKRFAAANGKPWQDFDTQLAFVDTELQSHETSAYQKLKSATTVDEATAAFIGYERPRGWTDTNPRNGHGYRNRLSNAAGLLGRDVSSEWTPSEDYSSIPYERRQQLATWGQNEYTRQQTAERAARRDDLSLMIQSQPESVTEASILEDTVLDSGDKASLLKEYRSAQGDVVSARAAVEKLNSGASFDPYDSDERKSVGLAYDSLTDKGSVYDEDGKALSLARMIFEKSGIIPQRAMNELRGGLVSGDPARVALSAAAAASMSATNPERLSAVPNGAELAKAARTYQHMTGTLGMSPVEAGQRMVDMSDPQKQKQREAVLETKAVKDNLKGISDADVRNLWDTWGPNAFTGYDVGATDAAKSVMVSDYKAMLEESLVEAAGDMDLAKQYASDRFKKIYGPSPLSLSGENTITYLPPENFYPAGPDGTHDYIRAQLVGALNEDPDLVRVHGPVAEAFMQATDQTRDDYLSGRPPRYAVYYRDQNGNLQQFPGEFVPDATMAGSEASPGRDRQSAFERNRAAEQERNAILESGGRGPNPLDEMNAAADEVRTMETRKSAEPMDVGGGGW